MDKDDNVNDIKVFKKLFENYNNMNKMMIGEMELSSEHATLTGSFREEMWMGFFRNIVPKKFSLEQGVMIIDSKGNISKEVDIAVFDEQFTPYVFRYNSLKFIPIEAVAIVIECKSKEPKSLELVEWAKSIERLETNPTGIARMATGYMCGLTSKSQKRTRPIKIVASLKRIQKEESRLEIDIKDYFDFIIHQHNEKNRENKFEIKIPNDCKSLGWWAKSLNFNEQQYDNEEIKNCEDNGLKIEYLNQTILSEDDMKLYIIDEQKFNKKNSTLQLDTKKENEDKENCKNEELPIHIKNTLKGLQIEGNPLLSLNLQLNQLLIILNNPMMFPHYAYAEAFRKFAVPKINKQ